MRSLVRDPKSKSQKWDGLIQMNLPSTVMTLSIKKHADFSESTTKTFPEPSSLLELLDVHLKEPSSQWEWILRGEILDLNHFLSSLHHTTITEEGETHVGNTKISVGVADAKRHVSTAAEWSSALHLTARATAFTFPHCIEELHLYGDFISSEFTGKILSSHPRVILFDIAIWKTMQGGHKYLLTDHALHLQFYLAIFMPDRVKANTSASAN